MLTYRRGAGARGAESVKSERSIQVVNGSEPKHVYTIQERCSV